MGLILFIIPIGFFPSPALFILKAERANGGRRKAILSKAVKCNSLGGGPAAKALHPDGRRTQKKLAGIHGMMQNMSRSLKCDVPKKYIAKK